MKKRLILLLLAGMTGGCWLPSGDPPPGNILYNTTQNKVKIAKPSDAVEYLVTALTFILLEKCPGERVSMGMDGKSAELAMQIFHESSRITGNTMTYDDADWRVFSELKEKSFSISLSYKGERIWQETLDCPFF